MFFFSQDLTKNIPQHPEEGNTTSSQVLGKNKNYIYSIKRETYKQKLKTISTMQTE